jgi:polar amino acid transport system permease protein
MRTCWESFEGYILRSMGREFGERLLPRGTDITLCDQFFLIGSGLIWNLYFAVIAISAGFFVATLLALAKNSDSALLRKPASGFIFLFRGSPLFIQFFFAYEAFVLLPRAGIEIDLVFVTMTAETRWLTRAWAGALVVLWLNTSAYTAQIFYGALRAIPRGDLEAADAYGMTGFAKFRRVVWPTMLRLAWPSYTNEAIFLTHATTLVFFSGFPAWQQSGDALYYARYFADQTFNPFVSYPIVAAYFIAITVGIIWLFGAINQRLNRHLPQAVRPSLRFQPQYIR